MALFSKLLLRNMILEAMKTKPTNMSFLSYTVDKGSLNQQSLKKRTYDEWEKLSKLYTHKEYLKMKETEARCNRNSEYIFFGFVFVSLYLVVSCGAG